MIMGTLMTVRRLWQHMYNDPILQFICFLLYDSNLLQPERHNVFLLIFVYNFKACLYPPRRNPLSCSPGYRYISLILARERTILLLWRTTSDVTIKRSSQSPDKEIMSVADYVNYTHFALLQFYTFSKYTNLNSR